MAFARSFDLTDDAVAKVKALASRTTTSQLLEDERLLRSITQSILAGGKAPRALKRMGRAARAGAWRSVAAGRHGAGSAAVNRMAARRL